MDKDGFLHQAGDLRKKGGWIMKIRPHFFISFLSEKNYECTILPLLSFGRRDDRFYLRLVLFVLSIGVMIEKKGDSK